MENFEWAYFLLGVVVWQLLKMFAQIVNRMVIEHRRKKVLKLVKVQFPDHTKITFVGIDSSDKRAMDKVVKQLREEGELLAQDVEEYHRGFPTKPSTPTKTVKEET